MAKKSSINGGGIFTSLIYIVLGALLLLFPGEALKWAMMIAGIVFIVFGALELLKKNYIGGILSLIIGVAIMIFGLALTGLVMLVLGVLIAIKGALAVIAALKRKRKTLLSILFPCLTIVCGVVLAFGNALGTILMIGAILIILDGIFGLIASLKG